METQANQSDTKTARRERPRLLLLISNGWAVRNYVRSGFIELLEPEVDITVMMPPGDAAFEAEMHARGLGVVLFRSLPMRWGITSGWARPWSTIGGISTTSSTICGTSSGA